MKPFLKSLRRAATSKVNSALTAVILVTMIGYCAICVRRSWEGYRQEHACAGARFRLRDAEIAYAKTHGHFLTGDSAALQALVQTKMFTALPACPLGGRYTAEAKPNGFLILYCSLPEHNRGIGQRLKPDRP